MSAVTDPPAPAQETGRDWPAWVSLVLRVVLGLVMIYAGWTKIIDLTGSVQSVVAYQLFPYALSELIGIALPIVEIAVGLMLVLGLLTRPAAAVVALMMVAFIAGIASAWARGLSIDCGCFGTGGPVAPGETEYLTEIIRDLAMLAAATWLVLRPRSPWSLDGPLTKGR